MKKSIFYKVLLLKTVLLISFNLYSQNLFKANKASISKEIEKVLNDKISKYYVVNLTKKKLSELVQQNKSVNFNLEIDDTKSWNIALKQNDIRGLNFKSVYTDDTGEHEFVIDKCPTYTGYLDGNKENIVFLTIVNDYFRASFRKGNERWSLLPLRKFYRGASDEMFVFYEDSDFKIKNELKCTVEHDHKSKEKEKNTSVSNKSIVNNPNGCLVLEVATDADHEYYLQENSDIDQVNGEIMDQLMEANTTFENNFDLNISITFQHVYTTASDPYTQANSQNVVFEFRDFWNSNRTTVQRDYAHFFSGKSHPNYGGFVTELGMICKKPDQSYGFSNANSSQVGTFGAFATIHEMSHAFNGEHGDGINCGGINRTIMCTGGLNSVFNYSPASITRINNYITSNSSCLTQISDATLEITGGDPVICNGTSRTLNLTNSALISNTNVTWTSSSNVNITSSNDSTASITTTGTGEGWVEALVTFGACNNGVRVREEFYVGEYASDQFSISGASQICPSQTVMFTANYEFGVQGNVTGHTWTWPSTYTYIGGQGTRFLTIQAPSSTSGLGGAVTLRVSNTCGTTSGSPAVKSFSPSFSCGFSFSLSPNPASQEVELAIEDNSEGEQLRTNPELLENYEVEISDMNGLVIYSKKAKAKKLKLNLNKMKKGLYNVKVVYKGEPKMEKLLINK